MAQWIKVLVTNLILTPRSPHGRKKTHNYKHPLSSIQASWYTCPLLYTDFKNGLVRWWSDDLNWIAGTHSGTREQLLRSVIASDLGNCLLFTASTVSKPGNMRDSDTLFGLISSVTHSTVETVLIFHMKKIRSQDRRHLLRICSEADAEASDPLLPHPSASDTIADKPREEYLCRGSEAGLQPRLTEHLSLHTLS